MEMVCVLMTMVWREEMVPTEREKSDFKLYG